MPDDTQLIAAIVNAMQEGNTPLHEHALPFAQLKKTALEICGTPEFKEIDVIFKQAIKAPDKNRYDDLMAIVSGNLRTLCENKTISLTGDGSTISTMILRAENAAANGIPGLHPPSITKPASTLKPDMSK